MVGWLAGGQPMDAGAGGIMRAPGAEILGVGCGIGWEGRQAGGGEMYKG